MCSEYNFVYYILGWTERMEKILSCLSQIDLVQSTLSSLCGFHFTNRKDYFLLASGMQVSNCTKVAHLFFSYPNKLLNIKPSLFFPHKDTFLIPSIFKKCFFLPGLFFSLFLLPVHWNFSMLSSNTSLSQVLGRILKK